MKSLEGSTILITGGTGSFGRAFTKIILEECNPKKVIIFSRDELKQHNMRNEGFDDSRLRYFIGDIRDRERLQRAMAGVDIVVHAAALKHVSSCEYNPFEAVQTNINGARNIVEAALDSGVKKVLALSTDKAVNPVNLYGATKLVSEKIFVQGNAYGGAENIRFSCVRYGNVVGSSGSVVPLFTKQKETGTITITDERMTRFWLTLDQGVRFVIKSIDEMKGGEIFVPKISSMKVVDLAEAIAPECDKKVIGIRAGEKLHECMISKDEARHTLERDDSFVIVPEDHGWTEEDMPTSNLPENFEYASDTNAQWLTTEELQALIK
ncbi:MAG: UDP-N-acetylglucosamine 4,6-dehydratase (inverting) [Flammeovirgaceae bacterium]|nr:UDP-N-acetylglucosamine 4,6-dehydratase (inverting) [Flammeovirgaceae bacterium]|tara:strand:+ start:2152 stop:3120 length:969 start_codon:yes stop_codon:yes gene_type:complete